MAGRLTLLARCSAFLCVMAAAALDDFLYDNRGLLLTSHGSAPDGQAGSTLAVARIEGVRYDRTLKRVMDPAIIEGVANKLAQKYSGGVTPEAVDQISKSVADGDTWIFEMAPRGAANE